MKIMLVVLKASAPTILPLAGVGAQSIHCAEVSSL